MRRLETLSPPAPQGSPSGSGCGSWCSPLAIIVAVLVLAPTARAGGGPENCLLVVNAESVDSLAIANAFATLRHVPPINVMMLPWKGSREAVTIAEFRSAILLPILRTIESRRLTSQIDCIVYSSDFPWRIDFKAELPAELAAQDAHPSGSLTGMTMLHGAVQSGGPAWLDAASNDYFRPLDADGVPRNTLGFRSWYGWSPNGDLMEMGGNRYLLAAMLGVTAGRGNTVPEIVRALTTAAAADGTRPPGTIYFMTNNDIRTETRSKEFPAVVRALQGLGVAAQVANGSLPTGKPDVAGLMAGVADFDWPASRSGIVPGAICENLTSFGGVFTPSAGQTPLSAFLRAGAAGSSGTVIEPFSIPMKFPRAGIHVHYARGASLVEAFYQSVQAPYQLLVVGDPLCQPWARIPVVEVVNAADSKPLAPGAEVAGALEIEPRATLPDGGSVDRFELFVDGVRVTGCGRDERLSLDTATLADGHHELRVVAISADGIETQGRRIVPVTFANHGRSLALTVEPRQVPRSGTIRVAVSGVGIESALVFSMGRVLGRTSGAEAVIEVPAELLGSGSVVIRATGRAGTTPAEAANATPVTIEVTDPP